MENECIVCGVPFAVEAMGFYLSGHGMICSQDCYKIFRLNREKELAHLTWGSEATV